MGWYIVGGVLALFVSIAVCATFASIAEQKGYSSTKYFWICFLLGIVGYIMVAALPEEGDRDLLLQLQRQVDRLTAQNAQQEPQHNTKNASAPKPYAAQSGTWTCYKCGAVNSLNYGQCKKCGEFKK